MKTLGSRRVCVMIIPVFEQFWGSGGVPEARFQWFQLS